MVTQYYKDDVESLGKVKLDLLGVKTLSVIHKCLDNIGRDFRDGLDWIPLNDKATYRTISQGRTDGVFQLEGWASKRGCKDLKPTKISDVIASMALFRPAPMNSGATADYISRKNKTKEMPQRHEALMKHTRATYGIFLYQEQVIYVLRDMGMGADNLTKFLKAVKASNSDIGDAGKVIDGFKEEVQHLAVLNGVPDEDFDWMWDAVTGFAAYGFNLAHSTVYGITAYISAYLATNYELEFYAALLNVFAGSTKQGKDTKSKEEIYLLAAKQMGIRILPADINASGVSYEVDPQRMGIRKGLMGVKGIGEKTARRVVNVRPDGGYQSVHEVCRLSRIAGSGPYLESGDLQVGSIGHFSEYGAFDDLVVEGGDSGEHEVE
jgi:DNA polymerase-3 subunit alpha